MDERDLNALIRMAAEAERMEQDSSHSFQWAKARSSRRGDLMKNLTGLGALAAAACVGMMVIVWMKAPQPAPISPIAIVPAAPAIEPPKVPEEGSVLLAVFHDADDRCSCIQLQHPWSKGTDVSQLGGGAVLRAAMSTTCHDNPDKVLAIAVSGPKYLLPRSTAEAEVLAACVTDNGRCGDDGGCYSNSAAAYLPTGVTVVAESMGMGQR